MKNLGPNVPLHLTAFHPDFKMLVVPATPPETLVRARKQALAAGLRHVYVGNIHDQENDSTIARRVVRCSSSAIGMSLDATTLMGVAAVHSATRDCQVASTQRRDGDGWSLEYRAFTTVTK